MRTQPRRESPRRRKAPLNQQRERAGVTGAGPPDQITLADVHTSKCRPGAPRLPASARHTTVRPGHPHCRKPHVIQPVQRATPVPATSASQAEQCAPNGAVCAPPLLRTTLLRGKPNRRSGRLQRRAVTWRDHGGRLTVGFSSFAGFSAGPASGSEPEPRRCLMATMTGSWQRLVPGPGGPAPQGRLGWSSKGVSRSSGSMPWFSTGHLEFDGCSREVGPLSYPVHC